MNLLPMSKKKVTIQISVIPRGRQHLSRILPSSEFASALGTFKGFLSCMASFVSGKMFESIESSLTGRAYMYPFAIVFSGISNHRMGRRWVLCDFDHSFDFRRRVVSGRCYSHNDKQSSVGENPVQKSIVEVAKQKEFVKLPPTKVLGAVGVTEGFAEN